MKKIVILACLFTNLLLGECTQIAEKKEQNHHIYAHNIVKPYSDDNGSLH